MLVAQVCEHERDEAHMVEAVECRRVGRRLHRDRPVARVEHLPEEPLEVDRLRRRSLDAATLAADAGLDRPDQARPSTGGGEDRIEQKRRRRLSVRAGDPGHPQFRRRTFEELVGDLRHRGARRRHHDLGHAEAEGPLHDERDRAPLHGLGREVVAVGNGPGHAEEERSRPDGTGIVGEVAHLDRSASDHVGRPERGDEALQIHHRPASLATAQDPPEGGRPEYASPVHGEGGPVTRPAFCGR